LNLTNARHKSVLLVDDSVINRMVIKSMFKETGIEVVMAVNGLDALHHLQKQPFDLVLMDCQMPEMDGYETSRAIRSNTVPVLDSKIPIIALTASSNKHDRDKCLEAGMDDYVEKPIYSEKLELTLNRWLAR
jgi:CheY-like chemotaxis protein